MNSLFKLETSTIDVPLETENINQEDYSIIELERNLQDWTIPNVPINQIYKQSTFSKLSFLTNYTIKTVEKTISLNNDNVTLKDLQQEINEIKKEIRNLKASNTKLEVSNEQLLQEIILLKIDKNNDIPKKEQRESSTKITKEE